MVAAGPSTCGDLIAAVHHRTTAGQGQGVDVRLACPLISIPSRNQPSLDFQMASRVAQGTYSRNIQGPLADEFSWRRRTDAAAEGRHHADNRGPQYQGQERIRQHSRV